MISSRLTPTFVTFIALLAGAPAHAADFILCIHEPPAELASRTDPQTGPAYWRAFARFGEELKSAGILRGGSAFDASAPAKTVKPGEAASASLSGMSPTAVFSGYFIIEVSTEAEALAWASRVPAKNGYIEVRTLLSQMGK